MKSKKIFKKLKILNVSKIYISFFYKENNIDIISIITIMKNKKYYLNSDNEIFKHKSYITKPIFDYNKKKLLSIHGLLIWDIVKKEIIISGKKEKLIKKKFCKNIK